VVTKAIGLVELGFVRTPCLTGDLELCIAHLRQASS
jgi:hypothetical protein